MPPQKATSSSEKGSGHTAQLSLKRALSGTSEVNGTSPRKRVRASTSRRHWAAQKKSFPFLQLPGEIRNMIYAYIVETTKRREKEDRSKSTTITSRRNKRCRTSYLALIQVCRQIRNEFKDTYMDSLIIYPHETTGFVEKFLRRPHFDPFANTRDMYTRSSGTFVLHTYYGDTPGDLLSLAQLLIACPDYNLELDWTDSHVAKYMHAIYEIVTNKNEVWNCALTSGELTHVFVHRPNGASVSNRQ
jgi:hypothetical protein